MRKAFSLYNNDPIIEDNNIYNTTGDLTIIDNTSNSYTKSMQYDNSNNGDKIMISAFGHNFTQDHLLLFNTASNIIILIATIYMLLLMTLKN